MCCGFYWCGFYNMLGRYMIYIDVLGSQLEYTMTLEDHFGKYENTYKYLHGMCVAM